MIYKQKAYLECYNTFINFISNEVHSLAKSRIVTPVYQLKLQTLNNVYNNMQDEYAEYHPFIRKTLV